MKLNNAGNNYFINCRKEFNEHHLDKAFLIQSLNFAYSMVYEEGYHRNHRSGGNIRRSKNEILLNAFQGKLAEVLVYSIFGDNGIKCNEPDLNIYGEGKWDDVDIEANGKLLCIKSAAFFSNLLLLEAKDWDNDGNYIPNINVDGAHQKYDYFLLVRIKPDIKSMLQDLPNNKEEIQSKICSIDFTYDIAGWCTTNSLIHIMKNNYFLPQNSLLNGKIKMDADNYYIQAGNLRNMEELIERLKL